MIKQLLSIRDYLTVCIGANASIPSASLDLCGWLKSQYPLLENEELIIVAACLIRSLKAMHNFYPLQQDELDKAVHGILANRYKK
jgi:hypothetical protein